MRVALAVGKMMVFAVDGHPFAGYYAGEYGEMKMHQKPNNGVQLQAAVGFRPVQVNGRAKNGNLQDHNSNEGHPKIVHSNSGNLLGNRQAGAWQRASSIIAERILSRVSTASKGILRNRRVVAVW
jgi:hypothetical protein